MDEITRAVMVEMGRKGGRIGGKRRAARLSAERRSEIASNAAKARWAKRHTLDTQDAEPQTISDPLLDEISKQLTVFQLHPDMRDDVVQTAALLALEQDAKRPQTIQKCVRQAVDIHRRDFYRSMFRHKSLDAPLSPDEPKSATHAELLRDAPSRVKPPKPEPCCLHCNQTLEGYQQKHFCSPSCANQHYGQGRTKIAESQLRELYIDKHLSLTKCAEELQCHPGSVQAALKRYGIPRRRRTNVVVCVESGCDKPPFKRVNSVTGRAGGSRCRFHQRVRNSLREQRRRGALTLRRSAERKVRQDRKRNQASNPDSGEAAGKERHDQP